MNSEKLHDTILSVYQRCHITTLPIDCFDIMQEYGYTIKTYSELTDKKREACLRLSRDACLIENTLFYEHHSVTGRVRFSAMHELGHILLSTDSEDEADAFASNILAPRILIHKLGYRSADQIHAAFGLSYAASNRALISYNKWFRDIAYSRARTPSEPELQLEQMFFPPEPKATPVPVIVEDDDTPQRLDPTEKYLLILRIIKAGLPVPTEYKKDVQWYKRNGFRLK